MTGHCWKLKHIGQWICYGRTQNGLKTSSSSFLCRHVDFFTGLFLGKSISLISPLLPADVTRTSSKSEVGGPCVQSKEAGLDEWNLCSQGVMITAC
jgi:hypothetical protein